MRQYCLPLLLLCGCTTFTNDEAKQLADAQQFATTFFRDGKLGQTMIQVDRGLDIDPDDYKLNALKGATLLRASLRDNKRLDEASEILEKVYEWRSPMRHEPYELFYLGLARQKQGLRHLGEAIRVEDRARRAADKKKYAEFVQKSKEEREAANSKLESAMEVFDVLVERGERLRLTHNHRMQVARQLGDDKKFLESAKQFFEISKKEQDFVRKEIERTPTADYEAAQLEALRDLEGEELDVRALVADWHFHRKKYDVALEHINRALALDPTRSDNYYNRGRLHLALKNTEDAKTDFRRFLATSQLPASDSRMTFATKALTR